MEYWKKYYDEASSYSKAAFGAFNKKRLGNHVIYNLVGLAIENYLTALCMKINIMPEHSSIGSMLHLLKKQIEVPGSFAVESRFINKFMNFCSLEVLDTPEPGVSDLVRMLSFTEDIKIFTEEILGVHAENV
jgi:hypothetical protein